MSLHDLIAQGTANDLTHAFAKGGGGWEAVYQFVLTGLLSAAIFWLVVRMMRETPDEKKPDDQPK